MSPYIFGGTHLEAGGVRRAALGTAGVAFAAEVLWRENRRKGLSVLPIGQKKNNKGKHFKKYHHKTIYQKRKNKARTNRHSTRYSLRIIAYVANVQNYLDRNTDSFSLLYSAVYESRAISSQVCSPAWNAKLHNSACVCVCVCGQHFADQVSKA